MPISNPISGSPTSPPRWLRPTELAACEIPEELADWMRHPGSLTERLTQRFGPDLRVQVLREGVTLLQPEEHALLDCASRQARCREIVFHGSAAPLVFARTIIPEAVLEQHGWLLTLGNRSLGNALAARDAFHRMDIGIRALAPADRLLGSLVNLQEPDPVWCRRSVFSLDSARLLVYEAFLTGLAQTQPHDA